MVFKIYKYSYLHPERYLCFSKDSAKERRYCIYYFSYTIDFMLMLGNGQWSAIFVFSLQKLVKN